MTPLAVVWYNPYVGICGFRSLGTLFLLVWGMEEHTNRRERPFHRPFNKGAERVRLPCGVFESLLRKEDHSICAEAAWLVAAGTITILG